MSYCRQNPTLWPGQSLSSPIRRRFFHPPNGAIRWMHQYVYIRLNTSAYVCLRNRGGGGHRIDWRGYGTDAPYLFVLTHQGQVNIWRWIALDFCLKVVLAFYVCAHRLMHTYTSTYAYVRLNTPRIRQGASEAPLKRLWSASDASLRRLWGASEAPLRSASEAPQKRLWGASEAPQRRLGGAASAQRSSKSSAPLN